MLLFCLASDLFKLKGACAKMYLMTSSISFNGVFLNFICFLTAPKKVIYIYIKMISYQIIIIIE